MVPGDKFIKYSVSLCEEKFSKTWHSCLTLAKRFQAAAFPYKDI